MLGDQAKAQELVNNLKSEAARTPFGMEDLAKGAQTLMAFGMSADEAQLRLGQLGDISQGDAVKLESLTLAFAQMSSTGKLTGQDLNQMINAGFNPLEEMSRKTGKSIGELKDEMGKGAISAQMVADAFESATAEGGRFYGAMDAQSQTFSGQMATLEDGVANLKGLLASGLSTALAGTVLPMVNGWVDELTNAFETGGAPAVIDAFGGILQEALAFIAEQLPVVVEAGMSILTALLDGLISVLPEVAATALTLVVSLVQAIIEALPALLEAAVQIIATLVSGIGEALPELIPAAIAAITALVQGLVDNLPLLLDAALQLILGLAQGLLAALPVLIESLPAIIEGIIQFLLTGIPMIIDAGIQLLTSLVGALPQIITSIVAVLPQIITSVVGGILGAIPQLVDAGLRLLTSLIGALPQIIVTVVAAIPQIIASVISAVISAIPQIVTAGGQLLVSLIQNLPTIIGQIVAAIPQIITGIVGAVADGVSQMASVGGDLVRGLWNGIQSLAGWLWDNVSGWIGGIWDGITGFFGINSPSKEMAWVGQMLVAGLTGAINKDGHQAVDAAQNMAEDVMGAMSGLEAGINVPITTNASFNTGNLTTLTPAPHGFLDPTSSGGSGGFDLQSLVSSVAESLLGALDLRVVLDDGALVGKLTPSIDARLQALSRRDGLLTGH